METIKLTIDGVAVEARAGQSVLSAALEAGIYIPHLCSHPDLTPEGGCKLCVVEVDGAHTQPVTACTTTVREGMQVVTRSEGLNRIRRTSMELMLAGHPEDCTSCRSYLKCELQAMMQYLSVSHARMRDVHRTATRISAVNPLIDREMERCIQCGRCIRACRDLRGVGILEYKKQDGEVYVGVTGDLSLAEADCRFCGACVEVCPTGALQDREGVFDRSLPREQGLIPCSAQCPAHINIPGYLEMIAQGKYAQAVAIIREKVPFPLSLGRVCTHYCEGQCKRGGLNSAVAIRDLKRFAVEHDQELLWKKNSVHLPATGKKVAVVGAGPCGLTAAYYLAKKGHAVTLLERLPVAGGMMTTGIPAYRLPREEVRQEVAYILEAGVTLRTGVNVTNAAALLEEGYDGVLVAVGAAAGKVIALEGYVPQQCTTAVELLREVSLGQDTPLVGPGKRVLVLGGGNVAFDAARVSARLGAQVTVTCLEERAHMLADEEEIVQAQEEGVTVLPGHTNLRFVQEDGRITGLEVSAITGFRFDGGKLLVDVVPGSQRVLEADTIIFAAGQKTDLTEDFGLPLNRFGYPELQGRGHATPVPGVYAAGDVVTGTKAVIDAIQAGREAAQELDAYLGGDGNIDEHLTDTPPSDPCIHKIPGFAQQERAQPAVLPAQARRDSFAVVDGGYTEEQAQAEAARCLKCPLRTQIHTVKMWTAYQK
ncbi:MAG TPA: ferredoxin [Clostridiales bacterium]|nr:ferredoxin [Clostridiales bacterium]